MLPASPTPAYGRAPGLSSADPTRAELVRLIEAVNGRGEAAMGLRILPDNRADGWAPVTELLEEGACFALRVRREVLALDADSPEAVTGLRRVAAGLRRRGLEFVHLRSGGAGREHLFVRLDSPRLRDAIGDEARRHRIDVRNQSPIRPPGVAHRSGVRAELIQPSSWADAARILEQSNASDGPRLSARLRSLIRDGDLDGRYTTTDGVCDGSALVLGICHLARAEGVDPATVFDLLQHPGHRGGEALRARNRRRGRYDARWWFHHTWRKTAGISGRVPHDRDQAVVAELEEDLTRFLAQPRGGQRGNSDVAVFTAMIRTAQQFGARQAPMSVRVLAERSGKDVKTVRSSLARLHAEQVVTVVDPAHLDRAAVWEVARIVPTGPLGGTGGCESGGNLRVESGHDGFAHGALGTGAWRVLNALGTEEGATATEVAEVLGVHVGSVRRHLTRMESAGLVSCCDGRWRRADTREEETVYLLELVAERRGTAGRRARRHRGFELERQRLREVLTSDNEILRRRMELALGRGARRYYAGIIAGRRAA